MEIIDNDREFTVALIPEQYHSVPSAACLHLPATNEEIMDAIDRARTDGVPSYIEVRVMRRSYLKDCLMEYPNLFELNLLARKLEEMSSGDETLYKAMLKREQKPIETARLINLTYNLEQCCRSGFRL